MKPFKHLFIFLLLPTFAFVSGPKANKFTAKKVIRRTAIVIIHAHKKVKEGKIYKRLKREKFTPEILRVQ